MKKVNIVIGFISNNNTESISIITKIFLRNIRDNYSLHPLIANRKYGGLKQSQMNIINIFYFIKHSILWVMNLLQYKPIIAHYPITSAWNFEKSMFFLQIAKLMGIRTIGHLHGGAFISFFNSISPFRKWIGLKLLCTLDAFVVLSNGWKKSVISDVGLPENKVFVVNNPIDEEFEKSVINHDIDKSYMLFIALNVVAKSKGIFDLLDAIALLPKKLDYEIKIIGPERDKGIYNEIDRFIDKYALHDKIHLIKQIWGFEKIELFNKSSALILPSYIENFPLVISEAAAAGLAIISTPIGAIPEYFKDGESIIFINPGKPHELSVAINRIISDKQFRNKIGKNARSIYQKQLSIQTSINSLKSVYGSVLKN